MVSEKNRERAKGITENIYKAYGSHSGFLFGIPPQFREAVEVVVAVVLDFLEAE